MEQGAYGENLGSRFSLETAPALVARTLKKSSIAVTEIRSDRPIVGRTGPIPREDAFLVGLQIRDYPHHQYWEDGRKAPVAHLNAGEIVLYDLKRDPIVYIDKPFHSIHFYLCRATFDEIAERENARRIADLSYRPGAGTRDPVIGNLGSTLLAAFERPEQASRIFVDHVTLAVAAHVAQAYGGMVAGSQTTKAGLASWQERKAKELIAARLDGDVCLSELAAACRLSTSHFARAFRQTTGFAPHQWLLHRRVDQAKEVMTESGRSLSEVALACGFADQSHFTRVFSRLTGASPGAWRRANCG